MRNPLGDRERLVHMVDAMTLIEEFTTGINYETYQGDLMRRLALVKLLENIGEAANAISEDLKTEQRCRMANLEKCPQHPDARILWHQLRNRVEFNSD